MLPAPTLKDIHLGTLGATPLEFLRSGGGAVGREFETILAPGGFQFLPQRGVEFVEGDFSLGFRGQDDF